MQVGIIGLGRMGSSTARRLMRDGHDVVVFNRSESPLEVLAGKDATAASSLKDMAAKLAMPRVFWSMLPADAPTETTIETLSAPTAPGDIVIDGGNTVDKDEMRRAVSCNMNNLHYVDVDTSGGVWGLERGVHDTFGDKLLSAMRLGVGGHVELQPK